MDLLQTFIASYIFSLKVCFKKYAFSGIKSQSVSKVRKMSDILDISINMSIEFQPLLA